MNYSDRADRVSESTALIAPAGRTWTLRVPAIVKHEPKFTPGTKWSYSNTDAVIAGLIIDEGHLGPRQ
ncbi:MAG: hypothetical protein QG597_2390 [Actinomycetota bacterium]|nr:hypothetical protein [Actinomycetota bacterium]